MTRPTYRYTLLRILAAYGPLTVRETMAALAREGYGRPAQLVAPLLSRYARAGDLIRADLPDQPCTWDITPTGHAHLLPTTEPLPVSVLLKPPRLRTLVLQRLVREGALSSRALGQTMLAAGRRFTHQNVYQTLKSYEHSGWIVPAGIEPGGVCNAVALKWAVTPLGQDVLARDLARPDRLPLAQ